MVRFWGKVSQFHVCTMLSVIMNIFFTYIRTQYMHITEKGLDYKHCVFV